MYSILLIRVYNKIKLKQCFVEPFDGCVGISPPIGAAFQVWSFKRTLLWVEGPFSFSPSMLLGWWYWVGNVCGKARLVWIRIPVPKARQSNLSKRRRERECFLFHTNKSEYSPHDYDYCRVRKGIFNCGI